MDLRYLLEVCLVLPVLDPVDESSHIRPVIARSFVIATQMLGHLLVVVEDAVGVQIRSYGHCAPQLSHVQHLVAENASTLCCVRGGGGAEIKKRLM